MAGKGNKSIKEEQKTRMWSIPKWKRHQAKFNPNVIIFNSNEVSKIAPTCTMAEFGPQHILRARLASAKANAICFQRASGPQATRDEHSEKWYEKTEWRQTGPGDCVTTLLCKELSLPMENWWGLCAQFHEGTFEIPILNALNSLNKEV